MPKINQTHSVIVVSVATSSVEAERKLQARSVAGNEFPYLVVARFELFDLGRVLLQVVLGEQDFAALSTCKSLHLLLRFFGALSLDGLLHCGCRSCRDLDHFRLDLKSEIRLLSQTNFFAH